LIEPGLVNLNRSDRERGDGFLRAGAAFVACAVGDDVAARWEIHRRQRKLTAPGAAVGRGSLNLCATRLAARPSSRR
jgi:hypothetical protein